MRRAVESCPDPETLGAFIEGMLDDAGVARVARHIDECADCLAIVAESSRYRRESGTVISFRRPRFFRLTRAAAAAAIVIAGATAWMIASRRDPIVHLGREARALPFRMVESRLADFDYGPSPTVRGKAQQSESDPRLLHLRGIAGDSVE